MKPRAGLTALACALAAGCGGAFAAGCAEEPEPSGAERPGPPPAQSRAERPAKPSAGRPKPPPAGPEPAPAPLEAARCPPGLANCRSAKGRIVYVERVDPDGDGDAHFVLSSRQGVTAPGIAVIDVKRSLRPRPLPGPGDRISAAGPVYRGSYGQRQIEAIELHVARD